MNPRREAPVRPVAARRDRPELPGLREEVLHRVPPAVHVPVMLPYRRPVPPRRDHRLRAPSLQVLKEPVRAGRPVADQRPEREAAGEIRNPRQIVRLAGEDREPHKAAGRVHEGHGPARQAASRAPDPLA